MKDIKTGDRVVVHAIKGGNKLTAAEVKIGTLKGAGADMSGMKMGGNIKTAPQ